jgi:lysophospholipase
MILFAALITYLAALTNAIQLQDQKQESAPNALGGYAPQSARCPPSTLIRPASSGVGNEEQAYISARKINADNALKSWLTKVGYREVTPSRYPSVGLSISGGGYRSMLEGAGIIQAFDSRDSKSKVAGLYQALTYQSGLSGGGWLLSSIAGNNWATVSSLVSKLWTSNLSGFILTPGGLLAAPFNTARVISDINSKSKAGFGLSLTDPWGRLISFQVLGGGGFVDIVAETLSSVTQLSSFKSYSVPYPILTAIQTRPGQCLPKERNPQFEIHPFEFGSWDGGIGAFMQTSYLGTRMNNGVPLNGTCTQGFDDLGFVIGTSSNLFSMACAMTRNSANPDASADMSKALGTFLGGAAYDPDDLEYACYPNPFQNSAGSPRVSDLE